MSHQSPNKRRQSFDASISKRIREADSEESGLEEYDWEQNIDPDIREHEEEEEEEVYYMYVGDQAHYLTSEDLVEPNCISPNQVKTPVKARKTILEDLNIPNNRECLSDHGHSYSKVSLQELDPHMKKDLIVPLYLFSPSCGPSRHSYEQPVHPFEWLHVGRPGTSD
ncbi:hypothetical protein QFC24_006712 [Naganishia onofrii]|uniref:Uncharacterized protein n=1 Tax=Naganishia onofrii TaxID=1851511 RepID=A0ACC2WY04_9TREE|nr:hypothetical protein QFC24_006712 [Naganishia onofrii]